MRRINPMWRLAFFLTKKVMIPICSIFEVILLLIFYFTERDSFADNVKTSLAALGIVLIASFFLFVLVGYILFVNQKFRQDEKYFYQGKIKLEKDNLKSLTAYDLGRVIHISFKPIKENSLKSHELKYYFGSIEEYVEFVVKNGLMQYLDEENIKGITDLEIAYGKTYSDGCLTFHRHKCPCCGNMTFLHETNGTYSICPVCFWEDDGISEKSPDTSFKVNKLSLNQARKNYISFGAIDEKYKSYVRKPYDEECSEALMFKKLLSFSDSKDYSVVFDAEIPTVVGDTEKFPAILVCRYGVFVFRYTLMFGSFMYSDAAHWHSTIPTSYDKIANPFYSGNMICSYIKAVVPQDVPIRYVNVLSNTCKIYNLKSVQDNAAVIYKKLLNESFFTDNYSEQEQILSKEETDGIFNALSAYGRKE